MRRMLIRRPAVGPLTGARIPTGLRTAQQWCLNMLHPRDGKRPQRSAEQQSSRKSSRLATTSIDGRLIKEVGRCLASGAQSLNVTYGSQVR